MAEQPSKRIPDWLSIDLTVIIFTMTILGFGIWLTD
jgi:hypothetical protein